MLVPGYCMAKHRCQSNFESVISRFSCLFDLGSAAGRAGAVTALVGRGSGKLNNLHVGKVDVESLEHFLGLRIDIDGIGVKGRAVGHDIHAALTLLLLKLQRDAADGPPRNPFHQMRGEASNLVAKALGRDDGNILSDLLVGLEIMSQTGVVLLDENTCCLLDGLGANATLHRHMYEKSLEHQERPLQGGCKTGVCRGCNITPLHKLYNQILRCCYSHHLFSHEMH
mmetsp:Transcript_58980/g.95345  ORF Transcript_58980/g.95345 Transcript_58980/m.95345 type:complete len:226 (-) Transcript_58980:838-1515(-)